MTTALHNAHGAQINFEDLTPYLECQSLCEYLTHELSQLVPVLSRSLTAQSPEGLQKSKKSVKNKVEPI